jgi:predicted ATPase
MRSCVECGTGDPTQRRDEFAGSSAQRRPGDEGVPVPERTVSPEPESRLPHNLPVALTPLIGRERELAELDQLLAQDEVRLVSFVGPGGVGKTRLSLAVAEQQVAQRRFTQGVYFVELTPLSDPEQIVHVIAEAMRLPLQASGGDRRTPKVQMLDYLRTKEILLVLDNFEHLIPGAGLIVEILQAAPRMKVLTTSRERLRMAGEYVYPVQGLEYGAGDVESADALPAAVALFIQSAQRIALDFTAHDEERAQIAEICRLVEGMPLGIELAASWVEVLTPDEIIRELTSSLDILETEQAGVAERHRSMRAVIDSTWQRLDEDEKAAFAALSVFRGGFTRVAAEQVAGATLRQLSDLVAKSLIRFERKRNRYTMHELLRQFGAEKLAEDSDSEARARRRHGVRYCQLAQSLGDELIGARQMDAIAELEPKAENVRTAWQWAVRNCEWELVEQAMDGLGFFYEWQGRLKEGEVAFHLAGDALRATEDHGTQILLGQALTWHSVFDHLLGANLEADERLSEALDILDKESSDDAKLLEAGAFAWLRRGIQAYNRDVESARKGYERSLSLYQRIGHKWGIAQSLRGLGQVAIDDGNYPEAAAHFSEALELLREIGDRRSEAQVLHHSATALWFAGSFEAAMQLARRSHRLDTEIGDRVGLAWSKQIMAENLWTAGASEEALGFLAEAEALAAELGDSSRLANVYHIQSNILADTGRYREARQKLETALSLARRLDESARIAWCQLLQSILDLQDDNYDAAEQRLQESEGLFGSQNRGPELAVVYGAQAMTAFARYNRERGLRRTLASLRLSLQHHDNRVGPGLFGLVLGLADAGRSVEALAVWEFAENSDIVGKIPLRYLPQRWLESAIAQMSPEEIDAAKARYRDTELWTFVAEWVVELERMTDAAAG